MLLVGHEAVKYYPKGEQEVYFFEAGGGYKDFVDALYLTSITDQRLADGFRFASAPHFLISTSYVVECAEHADAYAPDSSCRGRSRYA